MKTNVRLLVIILGLCLALLLAGNELVKKNQVINEKSGTITDLRTEVKRITTRSGKQALVIRSLSLSRKELKNSNDTLLDVIDDLKIRLRHVISVTQTVIETNHEFELPLHDSVVLVYDTIRQQHFPDTLKAFHFSDEYINLEGVINLCTDSLKHSYHSRDKISAVLNREKRDRWWKIWEKRQLVLSLTNSNKHNTIEYSEHVQIVR